MMIYKCLCCAPVLVCNKWPIWYYNCFNKYRCFSERVKMEGRSIFDAFKYCVEAV